MDFEGKTVPTVCKPAITVPEYRITTNELLEVMAAHYHDHPRLDASLKVMKATTVRSRWHARPLAELLSETAPLGERFRRHFRISCDLAEAAAGKALAHAGV